MGRPTNVSPHFPEWLSASIALRGYRQILPHLQGFRAGTIRRLSGAILVKLILSQATIPNIRRLRLRVSTESEDFSSSPAALTALPEILGAGNLRHSNLQDLHLTYLTESFESSLIVTLRASLATLIHAAPSLRTVKLNRAFQCLPVLKALSQLSSLTQLELDGWTKSLTQSPNTGNQVAEATHADVHFPALRTLRVEEDVLRLLSPSVTTAPTAIPLQRISLWYDFASHSSGLEPDGTTSTVFAALSLYRATLRSLTIILETTESTSIPAYLPSLQACSHLRYIRVRGFDSAERYDLDLLVGSWPLLQCIEWNPEFRPRHSPPLSLRTLSALSLQCKHLTTINIALDVSISRNINQSLEFGKLVNLGRMMVGRWIVEGDDIGGLARAMRAMSPSSSSVSCWVKRVPGGLRGQFWKEAIARAEGYRWSGDEA